MSRSRARPPRSRKWSNELRRVYPLLSFLLPTRCLGCDRLLGAVQDLGACGECWSDLRPLRPPLCPGCGLPRPPATDPLGPARGRCAACLVRPLRLDGVRPAIVYDRLARRFLLRAKFGGRRELLDPLGAQLGSVLVHSRFATGCTAVVPVPSHPVTLLRRGFNPAWEIARRLAGTLELPLLTRSLVRRLHTAVAAKRMPARQRRKLSRNAFRPRRDFSRQRILLVDDVLTTGATVEACAAALREAGAREVRVAVWARTLPPKFDRSLTGRL